MKSKWLNQIKTGNNGEGEEWVLKLVILVIMIIYSALVL